jgi:hypothetical protein
MDNPSASMPGDTPEPMAAVITAEGIQTDDAQEPFEGSPASRPEDACTLTLGTQSAGSPFLLPPLVHVRHHPSFLPRLSRWWRWYFSEEHVAAFVASVLQGLKCEHQAVRLETSPERAVIVWSTPSLQLATMMIMKSSYISIRMEICTYNHTKMHVKKQEPWARGCGCAVSEITLGDPAFRPRKPPGVVMDMAPPTGRALSQIVRIWAALERSMIQEGRKAGKAAAKACGLKMCRKP